jgi:hypothetical protein
VNTGTETKTKRQLPDLLTSSIPALKKKRVFKMKFHACCMVLLGVMACGPSQASDPIGELKACARTADAVSRAACYEALGRRVLASDAESIAEIEVQTLPDTTTELPDALGGDAFAVKAGEPRESNRGLVTSCKRASDKKWFYIFENGQVWKQVDSRRRHHKDCHFYVTITKDGFGYKMLIDGTEKKIRINRRR